MPKELARLQQPKDACRWDIVDMAGMGISHISHSSKSELILAAPHYLAKVPLASMVFKSKTSSLTFQQQWHLGLQSCKNAGRILQKCCRVCMHQSLPERLVCERLCCLLLKGSNYSRICKLNIAFLRQSYGCSIPCLVLFAGLLEEPTTNAT